MNKVGIITIHKSPNYGGSLQAYALYHYICSLGYECEVIDLYRPAIDGYIPSVKFQRLIPDEKNNQKKGLVRLLKLWFKGRKLKEFNNRHYDELKLKSMRFQDFFHEIEYSNPYRSIDELYNNPPRYDILISGSDQIWNPTMRYSIEPYFLTFSKHGSRKISYASSIGLENIPTFLHASYREWLNEYESISVRENQARCIINSLLPNKKVQVVCDPTLLIPSSYWKERAETPDMKNYLLCFTLSYNKPLYDYASKVALLMGLKMVIFSHGEQEDSYPNVHVVYDAGPLQWIGWICNSAAVITDSFHATIFSIHTERPFQTYIAPTNKRGSRIFEIMDRFGTNKSLLRDLSQPQPIQSIDFCKVKSNIELFVSQSQITLKNSLCKS